MRQHGWAEAARHDLGYKSAAGVPAEIRRRFARVASLLELADDEFGYIRVALKDYEATVSDKISRSPATCTSDLRQLFESAVAAGSSHVEKLDHLVVAAGKGLFGNTL